ncbi:MAG: potassium channel family protein [Chloroflexota bacterium]
MKIVILGSGRVGAWVASALSGKNEVAIIDWKASAFERLSPDFAGETVLGNGIDVEVLRSAGTAEADVFMALANDDNRNLMAAQIARRLGAVRNVVRVYDPVRAKLYHGIGLDTVSPTVHAAERLFAMVVGRALEQQAEPVSGGREAG